jgi:lipid-A-disaccharide synthase
MYESGWKILMVAGEASADRHASHVIKAVKTLMPDAEIFGMGGPEMARAGMECIFGMDALSVMGFTDVIPKILQIIKVHRGIKRLMDERRPGLFIPVDLPDFNMRLANYAKTKGLTVLYYIAPQAWAWRRGRARTLAGVTDGLAVIFPFEERFFASYGVNARYVGHPFADTEAPRSSGKASWPPKRIGIMPGSRHHEVAKILPVMMDAKRTIEKKHQNLTWHLPVAKGLDVNAIGTMVDKDVRLEVALPDVDLAMVKSGTSSLEMAFQGIPEVICYKTSVLNYFLARGFVKIDHIGMPNIIAGKPIVPELIQGHFNAGDLARAMCGYLDDEGLFDATQKAYHDMRQLLGDKKASIQVSLWAQEMLETT